MKPTFILSAILFLCSTAPAQPQDQEMEPHSLYTLTYDIERRHWIWMERVIREDPKYVPDDFTDRDLPFQIYSDKSAKELFTEAGIDFTEGGSISTGRGSPIVIRATGQNHEKIRKLMKTVHDWRSGRTSEWHHGDIRPRRKQNQ